MKYNYRTGIKKSLWQRFSKYVWTLDAIFVTVTMYDLLFNNARIFINLLFWTAQ